VDFLKGFPLRNSLKNKNQPSQQTGSRNLMGPKMLPMIWGTYMKLVTKYQISAEVTIYI
jgi:hypothetical protein